MCNVVSESNEIKAVAKDWLAELPDLALYSPCKLYRIMGPLIMGLELTKLPRVDEYRPHFVIYSLFGNRFGNDIATCLSGPIILKEFKDRRGLQYSIPYLSHRSIFPMASKSAKEQAPLPFEGNISLKQLFSVMDEYSRNPPLSFAPTSYLQAGLREEVLNTALFIGEVQARGVLQNIVAVNWDANHFKQNGVEVNAWLNSLEKIIDSRTKC